MAVGLRTARTLTDARLSGGRCTEAAATSQVALGIIIAVTGAVLGHEAVSAVVGGAALVALTSIVVSSPPITPAPVPGARLTGPDAMLDVRALTKRSGGHLAGRPGRLPESTWHVVGYLGPNGSGKSTTVNMVVGATTNCRRTCCRVRLD